MTSIARATYPLMFVGFAISAWGADPFLGTWKLNVEKTKVITGLAPKEGNFTKNLEGNRYVVTEGDAFGNGVSVALRFTEPVNGGIVKYDEGVLPAEASEAVKRINSNTREYTRRQRGEVVLVEQVVVSKDGKTITAHAKGTNAQGKPFDRIEIWNKQ